MEQLTDAYTPQETSMSHSIVRSWGIQAGRASLALAVLGVSASASAATGWTNWGEVAEIVQGYPGPTSNEMVFFVASVASNPSSCGGTGFYFPVTTDQQKRMFALLTAAKMAGRRVQLYTGDTCVTTPGWGQALVTGIVVE
jgi:hypothetical protein